MSDDILRYICARMVERSIATGHASTADEGVDALMEAYDEQRAARLEAEAKLARLREPDIEAWHREGIR